MADYSYTLYDTAILGAVADTEHTLFQVAQGGDSTHTKNFTNSKGAGSLPTEEDFLIEHIGAFLDVNGLAADRENMWLASYLEVIVSDLTVLLAPLSEFAMHNAFAGHYTQAAAADEALIGKAGVGRKLEIPIKLNGGENFKVILFQGTATAAAQNTKVLLKGTLTRPR